MPDLLALSTDFVVEVMLSVPEITVGAVMRATAVSRQVACKGVTIARVLSRLGQNVEVAGFLGGSSGKFVQRQLEAEGLRGHYVWCEGEIPQRLIFTEKNDRKTIINEQGLVVASAQINQLITQISAVRDQFEWLSIAGINAPGISPESYVAIIDAARPAKIAVHGQGAALHTLARQNLDLLCISGQEASKLLGWAVESVEDAQRACMELHDLGNRVVIIGLERTALGFDGHESWHASVPTVNIENTVEADELMYVGALNALIFGETMPEMLRQSVAMIFGVDSHQNFLSQTVLRRLS